MDINKDTYYKINKIVNNNNVLLIAVSKFQSINKINHLIDLGQINFGENYVQELLSKYKQISKNICWHFIGKLQRNKVKEIINFIYCIHSVDSLELLNEIQKRASIVQKNIKILFQVKISKENSKSGLLEIELYKLLDYYINNINIYKNINVIGLMGITTFTNNINQSKEEFIYLKNIFNICKKKYFLKNDLFKELSMGMSGDYEIAIQEGATMIRIGSLIFGERNKENYKL